MSHKSHKEIERKFLVKDLPEGFKKYLRTPIHQGYIMIAPDMKGVVRLRHEAIHFYQTIKRGSGKIRDEFEVELTAKQFKKLWPTTKGRRLNKTRYAVPLNGKKIAFADVFHGRLKGLVMVEVEFRTVKECDSFVPPSWFGKEVTENKRYTNQSLAMYGLPKD